MEAAYVEGRIDGVDSGCFLTVVRWKKPGDGRYPSKGASEHVKVLSQGQEHEHSSLIVIPDCSPFLR